MNSLISTSETKPQATHFLFDQAQMSIYYYKIILTYEDVMHPLRSPEIIFKTIIPKTGLWCMKKVFLSIYAHREATGHFALTTAIDDDNHMS